jgi:hypothetical protein
MAIQHYAGSDSDGNINALYNDDVWEVDKIPATAIKITEAQWRACLAEQGKWIVADGALTLDLVNYPKPYVEPTPLPPTAEQLRIVELEAQLIKNKDNLESFIGYYFEAAPRV